MQRNRNVLALTGVAFLLLGAPAFAQEQMKPAHVPAPVQTSVTPMQDTAGNPATPDVAAETEDTSKFENKSIAVLQALDKITARVSEVRVPVGSETVFGSLKITVRTCKKSTPLETPEAAAFLQIFEQKKRRSVKHALI